LSCIHIAVHGFARQKTMGFPSLKAVSSLVEHQGDNGNIVTQQQVTRLKHHTYNIGFVLVFICLLIHSVAD